MQFLETEILVLEKVVSEDIHFIHALNVLPEVDKYNTLGIPENMEVTEKLLSDIIEAQTIKPQMRYVFVLKDKLSNNPIGLCGLTIGKPKYRNAEIWYKVHPQFWNKGYATDALKALLHFGFNTLHLHRIEAGCATENKASIRALEKAGFIREGHTRKLLPVRGQWLDNFGYAILEEDFIKL